MITIINYGSGNIRAIANIYEQLRIPFIIADVPEQVKGAEKIILPGVGAFDETISMLDSTGFREVLNIEVLENKIPVLGICVGMQILAWRSDEGQLPGLGWIAGEVRKIDKSELQYKPKLPHLGWNSVSLQKDCALFKGINQEDGFYFLHSYYFECNDKQNEMATTFYGHTFASAVNCGNVFGVQFHPEKSHNNGIQLLKNFADL